MPGLDLRKLDAYRVALETLAALEALARRLPRTHGSLADQLRRAATSVVLNTGEGAAEVSPGEKARFYRIARRSAAECLAILDCLEVIAPETDWQTASARELITRELEMLARLSKKVVPERSHPASPPGRRRGA